MAANTIDCKFCGVSCSMEHDGQEPEYCPFCGISLSAFASWQWDEGDNKQEPAPPE